MDDAPDFIELLSDPEMLQLMLFACPDGVVATDREDHVVLYTGASEALFGFPPFEVLQRSARMLFASDDDFALVRTLLAAGGSVANLPVMAARADDRPFAAAVSAAALHDRSGAYSGAIIYVRDHSELRRIEETLRARNDELSELVGEFAFLARHDQLTGLLRRGSAVEAAEDVLLSGGLEQPRPFGVAIFDLDHFKRVNDSYGHLVGDQVLGAVARVMLGTARTGDILGRFGGEEFIAFLPGADVQATADFAERVRAAVREARVTVADSRPIEVTVSAGVASIPACADSLHEAIRIADDRLFIAKRGGRDRVVGADLARQGRTAA